MVPMTGNKLSVRRPRRWRGSPRVYTPMGITAENVATRFESRARRRTRSPRGARRRPPPARPKGRFDDEIVPVKAVRYESDNERATTSTFAATSCARRHHGEKLGALKPVFSAKGSVTAGNSSPLSDGAAARW
jgi:acetyl-CoA acyltransferase